MKSVLILSLCSTVIIGISGSYLELGPPIPTIYLCGDSTEAPGGGGNGTEGWGQYLHYSFDSSKVFVNNSAIAGRSARSYTREGRFDHVEKVLRKGDWVVIEFGHNDGGSPYPASSDIGRADCPGAGMFLRHLGGYQARANDG